MLRLPRSPGSGTSSDHRTIGTDTPTYRFAITLDVEPDHPADDDPEWAADAMWAALTNVHGLRAIYTDIAGMKPDTVL